MTAIQLFFGDCYSVVTNERKHFKNRYFIHKRRITAHHFKNIMILPVKNGGQELSVIHFVEKSSNFQQKCALQRYFFTKMYGMHNSADNAALSVQTRDVAEAGANQAGATNRFRTKQSGRMNINNKLFL
jgi:hypothetical protein